MFLEDIIMKLLLVEDDIEISQMLENVPEGFYNGRQGFIILQRV